MLRVGRSLHAPSHGVRFLSWLLPCITATLLVATCANAQGVNPPAPKSDSTGTHPPVVPPPAPATNPTTNPANNPATNPTTSPATNPTTNPATNPISSPPRTVTTYVPVAMKQAKRASWSLHLHGGLFEPVDVNAPSPTLGMRLGRIVAPHLTGGFLTGWTFRRKNLEQPVPGIPGLKPGLVLARADGQLVPMMVFLQVNLTEKRFLVPIAGAAAGYEWFMLTANDYRTGQSAKATYANFAWEGWGGLGMRLDKTVRLDGELFYNGGSLERTVTDSSGNSWLEAIDLNGIGARVGLDIQF